MVHEPCCVAVDARNDKQEAKRIMDVGGFVMSGRVDGVLAVTRSLGDSSMKDFVVGGPYNQNRARRRCRIPDSGLQWGESSAVSFLHILS